MVSFHGTYFVIVMSISGKKVEDVQILRPRIPAQYEQLKTMTIQRPTSRTKTLNLLAKSSVSIETPESIFLDDSYRKNGDDCVLEMY